MTNKVLIIAEAGVNHNGSLATAKKLVDVAVELGADIVKFQTFKAENLVTRTAQKADYQKNSQDPTETQFQMLKKLELSSDDFLHLSEYCQKSGIEFLSTAFDEESLDFLVRDTKIKRIKIPSGELTNAPLIAASALSKLPLIISTGMATLAEIESMLDLVSFVRTNNCRPTSKADFSGHFKRHQTEGPCLPLTILHCTTAYPTPANQVNVKAMDVLRRSFGIDVGFSDHSVGTLASVAAAARGATVIEKHFTLDKNMDGPDHKASLDPLELASFVKDIRAVEVLLGKEEKKPQPEEMLNERVARKSLAARTPIKVGDLFSSINLTTKRPGTGQSPMDYWDLINRRATKAYAIDDLIEEQI